MVVAVRSERLFFIATADWGTKKLLVERWPLLRGLRLMHANNNYYKL